MTTAHTARKRAGLEGVFVEGTESAWPSRADKRRLKREAAHKAKMAFR